MGILNTVNSQKDIFSTLDKSSQGSFTLRMAPLIEIIFLLLIFFLVTANWRPKESFDSGLMKTVVWYLDKYSRA
jgi:biopolymer transport protein ExbD